MDVMYIERDEQSQVFRLLAGILHLGNINFKAKGEGSEVADRSGTIVL